MGNIYDLIIIGGGPAGTTAGIYSARHRVKVLLITDRFGGQVADKAVAVENYTGFEEISGVDLIRKFEKHLKAQKIPIEIEKVSKVEKIKGRFSVLTSKGALYESITVIVTTGAKPRQLGVSGEKEFAGRGVSYCVACDGPVFSGKVVAVVGGGNSGLEAAIFLSSYAKKIYILEYGKDIGADSILREKISQNMKIEIIANAKLEKIKGKKFVESIIYRDLEKDKIKEIPVSGVFAEIGHQPDVSFLDGLVDLNEKKEIITDPKTNQTKTPGLFAAGDVTDSDYKQIIISAGDGAKAAFSAFGYLQKIK